MNTTAPAQILCVDDEPELLRALALHLSRRYQVLTATSGAAALELLKQNPNIGVIISDMRMPGLSGAEFFARARILAPEAPRILLTGQTDMASAIAAVNEGQIFRFLTKPCAPPELQGAVEEALERRRAAALERTSLRRQMEYQQSRVDPFTGLATRQQLMATLEAAAYQDADTTGSQIAYCIEIDGSDEPKHPRELSWADELAKIIADRLRRHCENAVVIARSGVEQFVVIETGRSMIERELRARGEELLTILSEPASLDGESLTVGVSIGIAQLEDRVQWQHLLPQANAAAREARRTGASTTHVYRPERTLSANRQHELLRELRKTLDQEGLHLHYQPIIDVSTGRVRSLESLARWEHRSLGSIEPGIFIPLAEQSGDILRLGQWVLSTACREGPLIFNSADQRLAVNVSAKQLLDRNFLPILERCLVDSALPPQNLELELTESALMCDMKQMCAVLSDIRKLNVRIAIDDFGTGFSSLGYLSQLPIDVIKVDRIFVRDFNRGGKSIIKAALAIAQDLGLEVVIEGVETAGMLLEVRELGASLMQGYWFTKPLAAGPLTEWLRNYASGASGEHTLMSSPRTSKGARS